jgi:hypothetical protein
MINPDMGNVAVSTSLMTVEKLNFIIPSHSVKKKRQTIIENRIHEFQSISFFIFQFAALNFFGKRLGIISKYRLRMRKIINVKPTRRLYFCRTGKIPISKG